MPTQMFDHKLRKEIKNMSEAEILAELNKLSTESLSNPRLVGRDYAKYRLLSTGSGNGVTNQLSLLQRTETTLLIDTKRQLLRPFPPVAIQ